MTVELNKEEIQIAIRALEFYYKALPHEGMIKDTAIAIHDKLYQLTTEAT